MPKFVFHPAAVPMRYPDKVQQESTLFPLLGWPRKPPRLPKQTVEKRQQIIAAKAVGLAGLWRDRVESLGDAGWCRAVNTPAGLRQRAECQRCRPTFFIPKGATGFRADGSNRPESFRICHRASVCPFCYARWVRQMWMQLDHAVFHDPAGSGYATTAAAIASQRAAAGSRRRGLDLDLDLCSATEVDEMESAEVEPPAREALPRNVGIDLISWRTQTLIASGERATSALFAELSRLVHEEWPDINHQRPHQPYGQVTGGLQSLTVEPYTLEQKRMFLLTSRRLLVAAHGSITANKVQEVARKVKSEIKTLTQPTRQQACTELSRLLRYPTNLMRGDLPLSVASLHAPQYVNRKGKPTQLRMNSTTGSLRAARKQLEDLGIK